MGRKLPPYFWPTIASLVCIGTFLVLKPSGLSWWRVLLCLIFCASVGQQLMRSVIATRFSGRAAVREFAGLLGLLMMIGALLLLPQPSGWILLVLTYAVPMLARGVLKDPVPESGHPKLKR